MTNLKKGITIENEVKFKCTKCKSVLAIRNDKELFLRKITIAYLSMEKNILEVKCKDCSEINTLKGITKIT